MAINTSEAVVLINTAEREAEKGRPLAIAFLKALRKEK